VFWPLLDAETLVFTQFFARDGGQTPVNYSIFFTLVEPIVCLDERKTCWYLRVFQKIKDRDVNETL